MANYLRTGDCNQCGECCGSEGSPNQTSPWPSNWPSALRKWNLNDVNYVAPQLIMLGLKQLPSGDLGFPVVNGNFKIRNKQFYYAFGENGHGIFKDLPPYDGTNTSLECPLLMEDPGDGSRPCGLVGEAQETARQQFCRPETRPDYDPATDVWTQQQVDEWLTDHPSCSYVFQEVI